MISKKNLNMYVIWIEMVNMKELDFNWFSNIYAYNYSMTKTSYSIH
jgi:hypothetical protein